MQIRVELIFRNQFFFSPYKCLYMSRDARLVDVSVFELANRYNLKTVHIAANG
jgi:hypothetical protein